MQTRAHRYQWALLLAVAACPAQQLQLNTRPVPLGLFSEVQDINTTVPGFSEFRPAQDAYRLGASGASVTGTADGLRFASVQRSGPFSISTNLHLDAPVANAQAAAMLLIRQSPEPQAAFAALSYQADGRLLLLERPYRGAEVQATPLSNGRFSSMELRRDRDRLELSFIDASGKEQHRAATLPSLTDPVYVGIGVSAHTPYALQAATFRHVTLSPPQPFSRP